MFTFYNKGIPVFSSENLSDVEKEAEKYKKENNLKLIEVFYNGKSHKWI